VRLLLRWSEGWVEPVEPSSAPRHIMAQQILALALQEGVVGTRTWPDWWGDLPVFDATGPEIVRHLVSQGYLELDGDLAMIGPEAERRFGRQYFSDLTAVFSAAPQFLVLAGRTQIGMVGDDVLLAGRSWLVTSIDWPRRRCQVEPTDLPGRARWGERGGGLSFDLTRGVRDVLGGTDPAANRCLAMSLPDLVDPHQRVGERSLRLRPDLSTDEIRTLLGRTVRLRAPAVDSNAVTGLKFSAALPPQLAERTVAERLADLSSAETVLADASVFICST
jgi:ATP-dependent helicase Lhr and Lhr-like helicase